MNPGVRRLGVLLLVASVPAWLIGQQVNGIAWSLAPGGVFAVTASSQFYANELVTGYGTVPSDDAVAGMAVLRYRSNGVLVTEAAEPLSPTRNQGRFYARLQGNVNTGIAITSTSQLPTTFAYSLVDTSGATVKTGEFEIPRFGRVTAFLHEAPFNMEGPFEGTLTFTSTTFVYVLPLRGITNERGEFLFTTLPMVESNYFSSEYVIPHFADGGGWTTQVVLVNDQSSVAAGTLNWTDSDGQPISVTINNTTASSFAYTLPPGGSARFETAGTAATTRAGSVRVAGASFSAAKAMVLFSYRRDGITVTEAGAMANFPSFGQAAYFYGQVRDADSTTLASQTGFAVLNLGPSATTVTVQLTNMDGTVAGTGALTLQGRQRTSLFLTQVPGLENLSKPFRGMVQLLAPNSVGIAVLALRGTTNERGDYVLSTTPSFIPRQNLPALSNFGGTGFAHLAFGLGYSSEFVVFSYPFMDWLGRPNPANSGNIYFVGPVNKSALRFE